MPGPACKIEYKHPGHTLNKVERFQKLDGCDWLGLATHHEGGTPLGIPPYFDGVIQKDQIYPAGLYGEVFRTLGWAPLPSLDSAIALMGRGYSDATFIASSLNYPQGGNTLAFTLGDFLAGDVATLQGGFNQRASVYGMAFRFTGLIQLEAGRHHVEVESDEGFRLHINQQLVGQYAGLRSKSVSSLQYVAPASGLYPIELIYWENAGPKSLHVTMDGYTLNSSRLFNEHRAGETKNSTRLPTDVHPIAGWPEYGYWLFSSLTRWLFYRQPLASDTGSNRANAHILKLPRQYSGANFNASSGHLTLAQSLMMYSSGHIQYQLNLTLNQSEPYTRHPTLVPLSLNWNSTDYDASVQEIRTDACHHNDLQPAMVLTTNEHGVRRPCTAGFYDHYGSGGQGRVAVLEPGDHDGVRLH